MSAVIEQTDDLTTCLALRRTVFIDEQGVAEDLELDGLDNDALHVLARMNGTPIGCARILVADGVARIGRVCVLADHRGGGLGGDLMRGCMTVIAKQPDVTRATLGAQLHALAFYERLGFTAFGPVYLDADIEHREMEIAL